MLSGRKTILLVGVIALAIISSSCSFSIGFNIKNLSDKPIVVNYSARGLQGSAPPRLVNGNGNENREQYAAIPEERIAVDREKGTVEFKLLPNEEVELFWVTDRMDKDYEQNFRLERLSIVSVDGSISFEGRKVFQSFRPVKKSWYAFGPEIIGFVFEYR